MLPPRDFDTTTECFSRPPAGPASWSTTSVFPTGFSVGLPRLYSGDRPTCCASTLRERLLRVGQPSPRAAVALRSSRFRGHATLPRWPRPGMHPEPRPERSLAQSGAGWTSAEAELRLGAEWMPGRKNARYLRRPSRSRADDACKAGKSWQARAVLLARCGCPPRRCWRCCCWLCCAPPRSQGRTTERRRTIRPQPYDNLACLALRCTADT